MPSEEGKTKAFNLGAKKADQTDANSTTTPADSSANTLTGAPAEPQGSDTFSLSDTQKMELDSDRTGDRQASTITGSSESDNGTVEASDLEKELAAQSAANSGAGVGDDGETVYSSHPIANYRIGRWQFENATLRLKGDDVSEFEKFREKLPPVERNVVKKLDTDRVNSIVEARRQATQQFDSSLGRDALAKLHARSPTVGVQDIAHEARPQQDHNVPVIPQPPVDPEGKTGLDYGAHTPPDGKGDSVA